MIRIVIASDLASGSSSLRRVFKIRPAAARSGKRSAGIPKGQLVIACGAQKNARMEHPDVDLSDQPELAATILDALGTALLNRGQSEEGAALIKDARKIRITQFGKDHPATAASQNSFARVLREQGDYAQAEAAIGDALRINRAVYGDKSLPVAVSLNELGVIQLKKGLLSEANSSADEGLRILDTLGLHDSDPNTTRLLDIRGRAEAGVGQLEAASATYQETLDLDYKQLRTRAHPKYATHLANAGLVAAARGDFKQAERAFRAAIQTYETELGRPNHPNLIDAYANLGSLLRMPGSSAARLTEAGKCLTRALELSKQVRGASHPLVAHDYANLGRWQYRVGECQAALESLNTALRLYEKSVAQGTLPAGHYYIAEALTWKGRTLLESGDRKSASAAEPVLRKAIAAWPKGLWFSSLGAGMAQVCLGRAIYLQRPADPEGCDLVRKGSEAVCKGLPDPDFVSRVNSWRKEQKC